MLKYKIYLVKLKEINEFELIIMGFVFYFLMEDSLEKHRISK